MEQSQKKKFAKFTPWTLGLGLSFLLLFSGVTAHALYGGLYYQNLSGLNPLSYYYNGSNLCNVVEPGSTYFLAYCLGPGIGAGGYWLGGAGYGIGGFVGYGGGGFGGYGGGLGGYGGFGLGSALNSYFPGYIYSGPGFNGPLISSIGPAFY